MGIDLRQAYSFLAQQSFRSHRAGLKAQLPDNLEMRNRESSQIAGYPSKRPLLGFVVLSCVRSSEFALLQNALIIQSSRSERGRPDVKLNSGILCDVRLLLLARCDEHLKLVHQLPSMAKFDCQDSVDQLARFVVG